MRDREARAARESHDVGEQASRGRPPVEIGPQPSYGAGYVGLQPRPWCQVLERAFGVPPEDCLFTVSRRAIYAVVADPKRLRLIGATKRAEVRREIARLGASSRRVVLVPVSRRRFEAASAAQRVGGDAAALDLLKLEVPPTVPPRAKAYAANL